MFPRATGRSSLRARETVLFTSKGHLLFSCGSGGLGLFDGDGVAMEEALKWVMPI